MLKEGDEVFNFSQPWSECILHADHHPMRTGRSVCLEEVHAYYRSVIVKNILVGGKDDVAHEKMKG